MIVRKKCKTSFKLDLYEFEAGKYYEFDRREFKILTNIQYTYYIDNKPVLAGTTVDEYFYSDKALRLIKIRNLLRDDC